jgi:hypothetical protein
MFALCLYKVIKQLVERGLVKLALVFADNLDLLVQRKKGKELAAALLALLSEAGLQIKSDVKILPLYERDANSPALGPAADYKPEGANIEPQRVAELKLLGTLVSHDDERQLQFVRSKLAEPWSSWPSASPPWATRSASSPWSATCSSPAPTTCCATAPPA